MKYSELIKKCRQLIDSYNENIMTADSHADEFLTKIKCEDTERVFLKQVFYGFERYKGFIKASNDVIFTQYSTTTNRKTDYILFGIFTYLICFRMDELPFTEFSKMVLSQDMVKMNVLLSSIFNIQFLKEKVLLGWRQHLQQAYLQQKIFTALILRKDKCIQLISKVSENATGKKNQTIAIESMKQLDVKQKKKITVPEEFNLTKPKPKQLPQLQKIQIGFKANPVPKQKKDLAIIEKQKKQRRQQILQNVKKYYDEQKEKQFQFQTQKRPTNIEKLKQQTLIKQTKLIEKKTFAKPVPKYQEVDVKLNVAAILRQQKKLNEKIRQEEQRMKNLEINMRDESQFQNWKKQMKDKDKFEQLQLQQRRKIQMELARQAAMEAYVDKIQQKKNLVLDMKQIAKQLRQQRQKLQEESLQNKKKIIQQVQQIKENIIVQKEKILQKNKKIHAEQKQERKRIQEKKKQEEKVQMIKKKQLISQIKQLQKKIRAKPKTQIEYVSIGLLEQMTLDQLKNRLDNVKRQRKEEQQKKRQQNILKKEQFKSNINQKKNVIMAHRQQLAKQKQEERRKKKEQVQTQKNRLEQVKVKSMNQYKKKEQDKLKEKKRQKEKLVKQIKETEQRRMFLMQGQAAQENNAFMNLQKGQQRQILDRQNQKLMQQYRNKAVKEGQIKILAQQGKRIVQQKIDFNHLYNQNQHINNQMAETLQQEDQVTKAMQYHTIKTYEQKHVQNMTKTNPYKSKIAQLSLSKAKKASKA